MGTTFFHLQAYVGLVLGVILFAMQVFAFIDCLRRRSDAFTAAGKLSKPAWLAITGVAMVLGFLSIEAPLSIFEIVAVVGAAVYLADVRPAIQRVLGNARSNQNGPYGPW
ncbi:DUF2516 family protein [Rudaeicoccus suwonensis]|uniref:Uncharacterized protein DUF2516 n=1 Tax=Rudaeicoccus suwonensis TaxID=657409 RepID=A0A561DVB0_9MICO|nr:DUF2516 family protein [Rudaeicoccus suwonensis]TWE07301.1 uncharacterized protein DUF2516 [Rudaeicoccus suwonensis]